MRENLRATNIRYAVLFATTLTAFTLYLDRICMGEIAKTAFKSELGLTDAEKGWVLSAFFWAYALAQVPAGWLSDRFGARGMMALYITLWSFFTLMTGWATGLVSMVIARLGCGLAQAGAYPTSSGLLSRWFPLRVRGRASSCVAFGGRVGGATAPYLTALLIVALGGWRPVLLLYGFAGVGVAGLFWFIFRNRPDEHPLSNAAESSLILEGQPAPDPGVAVKPIRIPINHLVTSRTVWLMCIAQWGTNIGWIFLVTWLPTYLTEFHHVESVRGGKMTTIVLLIGMSGMLFGGWLTDMSVRRLGLRWGRKLPYAAAGFIAAAAYISCLWIESPWMAVAAFAVVSFSTDMGNPSTWAIMQDIGGRQVGSIFGWGNMWGNLGAAAASGLLLPWVIKNWDANKDWHEAFLVCAAGFVISGVAALGINATVPVVPPEETLSKSSI